MKVYLALADLGKATASLLSKRLSVPRTTVYSVLENLIAKGVISIEHKGNTTFYKANTPNSLLGIVQKEKEQVKAKEATANELVKLITPFFKSKNFSIPRLQLFEGKQNVNNMLFEHTDVWRNEIYALDYIWWGYQDHTFVEHYIEWLEMVWESADEKERVKIFSNQAPIEQTAQSMFPERREVRFLPEAYHFNSSIWVLGSHIVLLMTSQKPHYAYQFKDPVFAGNLRTLFKLLWTIDIEQLSVVDESST
ncbi:MAG: helix-turn-helix domain-containing protein [Deltaproteobacteria bacterium]|nr:helix-turn-helix domain-containing protein [Deltaproteobacteria bacterium]